MKEKMEKKLEELKKMLPLIQADYAKVIGAIGILEELLKPEVVTEEVKDGTKNQ